MSVKLPERIRWAVGLLDVRPDQRILEIGCGPGVAARVIGERLTGGRLVAIDRSATAIRRATARNADLIAAGRVSFEQADFAGYDPEGLPFHSVLAMNVNLFWTRPAAREWQVLQQVLRPGGAVVLCYGYGPDPGPTSTRDIGGIIGDALRARGYAVTVEQAPDGSSFAVVGHRPPISRGDQ